VAYKDADGKLVDVVTGELSWDIHKDESMWSLVPGEHVHVSLICCMTSCLENPEVGLDRYPYRISADTVKPLILATLNFSV